MSTRICCHSCAADSSSSDGWCLTRRNTSSPQSNRLFSVRCVLNLFYVFHSLLSHVMVSLYIQWYPYLFVVSIFTCGIHIYLSSFEYHGNESTLMLFTFRHHHFVIRRHNCLIFFRYCLWSLNSVTVFKILKSYQVEASLDIHQSMSSKP